MGDKGPCRRTRQVCFEVFGEPTAPPGPRKRSLDNPTSWEDFEALGCAGLFDNLHRPAPESEWRMMQLVASVALVGKDVQQPDN